VYEVSDYSRDHREVHNRRTVGAAGVGVAAIIVVVMAIMLPTASAQTVDGDIAISAGPADPGIAQVDFAVQNLGDRAMVQVDEIRLPQDVVPTAACRADFRGASQILSIDPSGVVLLPVATLDMPAMSQLLVSCRFEVGALCSLEATAAATWTAAGVPLFDRSAAAQVTPACEVETIDGSRRALAGLTMEASVESAPMGSVVTWTVTAQNLGTRRLTGAEFSIPLPAALAFDPSSEVGSVYYDEATRVVHARVELIRIDQSQSITFRTRIEALSLIPTNASLETGQQAWAVADGRVFGLPAEPTPTPEPRVARERPRGSRGLAYTGAETPFVAVIGVSLLAAGVMMTTTSRRR